MRTLQLAATFALLTSPALALSPSAFSPFVGRWAGHLEYQDFGADRRVRIPVKLSVRVSGATSAAWTFGYDDFGTTVSSLETHTWKESTYSVSTLGKPETVRYTSRDFAALTKSGIGTAILLGTALENGKSVAVRRTITLGKTTLATLTETRTAGGTYAFRNQSTYTRVP